VAHALDVDHAEPITTNAGGTANRDDIRLERCQFFDCPDVNPPRKRQQPARFPDAIGRLLPACIERG